MERQTKRKRLIGKVVSDKMDKTRVVQIERRERHKLYKKVITKRTKVKMHDEKNETKVGDIVEIMETRPLSREKRWRLVKIIERGRI